MVTGQSESRSRSRSSLHRHPVRTVLCAHLRREEQCLGQGGVWWGVGIGDSPAAGQLDVCTYVCCMYVRIYIKASLPHTSILPYMTSTCDSSTYLSTSSFHLPRLTTGSTTERVGVTHVVAADRWVARTALFVWSVSLPACLSVCRSICVSV